MTAAHDKAQRRLDDLSDDDYERITRIAERDYGVGLTGLVEDDPAEALVLVAREMGETATCQHCGTEGADTGSQCPRCERNRDTGRPVSDDEIIERAGLHRLAQEGRI